MSGITKFNRRSFLILSAAALTACKAGAEVLKLSGSTMGTTYHVVAVPGGAHVDEKALDGAIKAALAEVNVQMSNWDAGSEVSRINAAGADQPLALSPALAGVLEAANDVHRASEGRFDVTVGPLIELWGFGSGQVVPHVPSDAEIAEALARTGQRRMLTLTGRSLTKSVSGAEIYLPAIGKGHGVDRVAAAIRSAGLTDFMIEIGGDLYASGRNADGLPWQIGIESPVAGDRALHAVADASNLGMATSGDYRNFFESGGTRYSHIIDPATGRPILHKTVSATVLAENAMLADAWSTAMLVLGRDQGMQIAEDQGLAVVFIDREPGEGFTTTASSQYTSLQA
ncbi:FAD:protein FMN transferase [Vannielia litorea]|uniref:FAD:protein FMN transferase n=1 Tax=Vannielia litorea TaxID=1217970 RepID=A0A1N6H4E6_9RHOB|nr:FAD:protein FMN transferase [Vannielia litorea]SIO14585.1 thiamine biosynthesis lipoprotein [Vannielia litorea]